MLDETQFCFDLDGTVTAEELLPKISRILGVQEEIEELTQLTIEGKIPFGESFSKRVKILGAYPISQIHDSLSNVKFFVQTLEFIKKRPDSCTIITGNLDVWIKPLVEGIGVRFLASQGRVLSDGTSVLDRVLNKGHAIDKLRKESPSKIVAIGDGFGDIPMISKADTGVAFGGLHSPVPALVGVATHVIYDEGALCRFLELQ